MIDYFSMFTGIGGFELGIEKAHYNKSFSKIEQNRKRRNRNVDQSESLLCSGSESSFHCVGVCEVDKYANELLKDKFPGVKNYGDATKIKTDELPDFDLLCGGFPCQAFSIAGKRKGFEDVRGTMFFEIARILKAKKPAYFLLENVKGLLNHDKGQTFTKIIQTLDELGYNFEWMVLNSKFFGVPQNRERVFFIGSLRGQPRREILPFRETNTEITKEQEIIKECSKSQCNTVINPKGIFPTITSCTHGYANPSISCFQKSKAQHSRVYYSEGIAPTLAGASKLSGDCTPKIVTRHPLKYMNRNQKNIEGDYAYTVDSCNTGGVDDGRIRRLTPKECERLQGFPDDWTTGFSDTQRYKMTGNAVTVNVIKEIISKIKK
jgi:DNA (cytosine-5)-methyltransferase 1